MNIGDYVRTKGGNIFKIIGGNADDWEIDIDFIKLEQLEENWYESNKYNDNGYWFTKNNIIKSSPNIIDLIQEGDYVNGDLVYYRPDSNCDEKRQVRNIDMYGTVEYIPITSLYKIKSIVTKEQFEAMKYKVGE